MDRDMLMVPEKKIAIQGPQHQELLFRWLEDDSTCSRLVSRNSGKRTIIANLTFRYGYNCHYCAIPLDVWYALSLEGELIMPLKFDYPTIEHLVQQKFKNSYDGKNIHELANLRLACPDCNHLKGGQEG